MTFELVVLLVLLIGCTRFTVNTSVPEEPIQNSATLEQPLEYDNQGLSYRTIAVDDRLKLVELVSKKSPNGQLWIKWTLLNTEPEYPVDEAYVNVTILDKSMDAVENWSTRANANVSDDLFYLNLQSKTIVDQIGGYILEWQGLPERESYATPRNVNKPSALGLKDNLGIAYVLEPSDTRLQMSRVEATKNAQGTLEISGELTNTDGDAVIVEAAVTIKLYEEMGQNIGGFSVLARVKADTEILKFRLDTGLQIESVNRYSLQWNGPVQ